MWACTRNNTGCVESSFDQSPSVVSRFSHLVSGCASLSHCRWNVLLPRYHLRYCLSWSCIQISRTSPQRRAFLVTSLSGLVWWSRVGSCLGGFVGWLSRARASAFFYSDTLSARDVGLLPRPMGSLTARVLVNGGSALLWVSTSLPVLRQSSPGTARPLSHRLVSAEPRALTATRPLGHSPVFPHPDVKRVYLVDSFIARNPHNSAQTTSLVLTLSGHTFSG